MIADICAAWNPLRLLVLLASVVEWMTSGQRGNWSQLKVLAGSLRPPPHHQFLPTYLEILPEEPSHLDSLQSISRGLPT